MSEHVGGNAEGAVAAVVAAKLRGTRIWEGWIASIAGEGVYVYPVEPMATVTGRCSCGGKVRVVGSRGGNYIGTLPGPIVEKLGISAGYAERIIIVAPEEG